MKSRISSIIANRNFLRQVQQSRIASRQNIEAWIQQAAEPTEESPLERLRAIPDIEGLGRDRERHDPFPEAPIDETTTISVPRTPPWVVPQPRISPPVPAGKEEAISLLEGRPSLLLRGNRIEIPRSGIWAQPLFSTRALIEPRHRSVGRIEIDGGSGARHGGTG